MFEPDRGYDPIKAEPAIQQVNFKNQFINIKKLQHIKLFPNKSFLVHLCMYTRLA